MSIKFKGGELTRAYSADFTSIGYGNENAVLTGCGVTAQSPAAMAVDIDDGKVFFGINEVDVTGSSLSIDSNTSSFSRIDLVVVNSSGTLSIVKGTPENLVKTPDFDPDTYILLARIDVSSGASSITSTNITDLRTINSGGAGGTGGSGIGREYETFTSQTTVNFVHNLGDENVIVQVYDNNNELLIPETIDIIDENEVQVDFSTSTSGTIVVLGGISGGNAYYTEDFTSSTTWSVNHQLDRKYVQVQCIDSSDNLIEPQSVSYTDDDNLVVTFGTATAGRVIVTGGASALELSKATDVDTTNREDGSILYWNSTNSKYEFKDEESNRNTSIYQTTISASDTNTNTDISSLTNCKTIEIYNIGNSDCYIDLDSAASTSAGILLQVGANIILEDSSFDNVSVICDTGVTTDVNLVAYAAESAGTRASKEILSISSSDTSSTDSFTDTTNYKELLFINEGNSDAYVSLSSTATTGDFKLKSKETWSVRNIIASDVAAICDTGETTTIKVLGVY